MGTDQLQFESYDAADDLVTHYDAETDQWRFPRTGDFWDAVGTAHKSGSQGAGKRIAIIDSAFDVTIPKLRALSQGKKAQSTSSDENTAHGTAVALLIASIAPSARLDLYEVAENNRPNKRLVLRALRKAAESDAVIINFSMGRPVNQRRWWTLLYKSTDHCEFCKAASEVVSGGKLMVAAVGNEQGLAFCPARKESVLGIGFQTEQRKNYTTPEGGVAEAAFWAKPSHDQAYDPDYTVIQPEGVLGSSFATPLITGALALVDDAAQVMMLFKAIKAGGLAEALHATLQRNPAVSRVAMVKQLYEQALLRLPHRHHGAQDRTPCIVCSLFAQGLYVNAGLFFLESGDLRSAEDLLLAARWLAPWSPHAAANLAALWRTAGRLVLEQRGDRILAIRLCTASRDEYVRAMELRPNIEAYRTGLREAEHCLAVAAGVKH